MTQSPTPAMSSPPRSMCWRRRSGSSPGVVCHHCYHCCCCHRRHHRPQMASSPVSASRWARCSSTGRSVPFGSCRCRKKTEEMRCHECSPRIRRSICPEARCSRHGEEWLCAILFPKTIDERRRREAGRSADAEQKATTTIIMRREQKLHIYMYLDTHTRDNNI